MSAPTVLERLAGWWGQRHKATLRIVLSDYVLNGASSALGMFLVATIVYAFLGREAAAVANVGVIATLAPDLVAPRRGKLAQMVVCPLIGVPLFAVVLALDGQSLALGLFLVPATFFVFLAMAWGKRGAPIAIGVMLAVVFAMSLPPPEGSHQVLLRTFYCALGSALYVVYSLIANAVLNGRYRTQMTADLLLAVAALLQAHARRVAPSEDGASQAADLDPDSPTGLGELLKRQSALADQLQATRDVVLETPNTPRRQRLAGMLVVVLEMRDHLVASELDLDRVRQAAGHGRVACAGRGLHRARPAVRRGR